MRKAILVAIIGAISLNVNAGDWGGGKGVVSQGPKDMIGCPDTSGYVTVEYMTDYIYKGYRFNTDTVLAGVGYTFESVVPVTVFANHYGATGPRDAAGLSGGRLLGISDVTEVGISGQVANVGGVDVVLGYTQRFYSGRTALNGIPSSNGEINLGLSKDLGFARAHFDLFYNLNAPNSWNGLPVPAVSNDSGAWFWDFGLDKSFEITDNIDLVLSGGITYADNYWGPNPLPFRTTQTSPIVAGYASRSSGWNNYYLRASLPIEINCAATLTPYIGYSGAPDGFLMDGAAYGDSGAIFGSQSDILHAGVNLTVKF